VVDAITPPDDAAAVDNEPDAPALDDGAPAPTRGPSRAGFVLAVSLAVVLAVIAAVLVLLLASDSDGEGGDAAELRRTAGQFGEALVTYDHRNPEEHRDTVLGFATGSFREEYEDAFDQGLADIITEVEAVSQGFVKDVWVSEIDEERASAVVAVDIEHDGTAGPRTLYDIYFRLTFVKVDDTWKVDQVIDLNFGSGPAGAGTEGTDVTTDTTIPTTTSVP
jgi:Mce-associated membrane protein